MSDYLKKRQQQIFDGRPLPEKKKPKWLKQVSEKLAAKRAAQKIELGGEETDLQKWFNARRKKLTGTCQCGCGQKSSKYDDLNFRSSCCHVFPQKLFPSIALHPKNCVERAWIGGCHSNMDNRSMDKWPNFADWPDIVEKFYVLAPLLTDKERAKKFYTHLEKLVYNQ